MKFSIIVPSYNQESFIRDTLINITTLKEQAVKREIIVEILLFDSESNANVQKAVNEFKDTLDYVEVKKDKGQYDAINKGMEKCTGDYWTWLNTDDLLDLDGFFKMVELLKENPQIDYIYGGVNYIDEAGKLIKTVNVFDLNFDNLISKEPAIFQPGSFFKTSFTRPLKELKAYRCCFDYEFVLRCLKSKAVIYACNFSVSNFRFYKQSKTGSITPLFIREQLQISRQYGRKWYHFLTWFSYLRLFKHFLFPRK